MMQTPTLFFIDDEPAILNGLQNLLFDYEDDWYIHFFSDPQQAINALDDEEVTMVVTDLRMPQIGGLDVLRAVRERSPGTYRAVLSGTSSWDIDDRELPLVHDMMGKPCDSELLVQTIEHGLSIAGELTLSRYLDAISRLPVRPSVYARVQKLVNDEAPRAEISEAVQLDVGVSAAVLRVANAAFFSGGNPVNSLDEAVGRLGLNLVTSIVLGAEVHEGARALGSQEVEDINAHCVRVAERVAQVVPHQQKSAALMAGLLHDVGAIALIGEDAPEDVKPGSLSCHLLRMWNVAPETISAVAASYDFESALASDNPLAWCLYAAHDDANIDPSDARLSDDQRATLKRLKELG